MVEFITALLFGFAAWRFGLSWTLVEALAFCFALVCCIFIDYDHYLLPDIFTLSGILIGLMGAWINPDRSFWDALIGVFIGGGFLWAIAYFYLVFRGREGLGGGDIKMLAWIGAVLGWKAIPFVVLASSLTGAVFGAAVSLRSAEGMSKPIPFGPFLAIAALVYMLLGGESWVQWYLDLHQI
jgi:leader peptidase (prepilin peptidase)/N-methyltransferase